jgi:ATP-dependent protease HslVU (ClpYQ) ATPase subunit
VSFEANEMKAGTEIDVDSAYVNKHLGDLLSSKNDLMKFVL